jgi:hypothetical protein
MMCLLSLGTDQDIRLVAGDEAPSKRRDCLLKQLRTRLDCLDDFIQVYDKTSAQTPGGVQ